MFYKYEGLTDNVWLTNGVTVNDTPFGRAVHIECLDSLGLGVLIAILKQPARLSRGSIAYLRTFLELTQSECAKRLGVNEQTVSLWERGSHPIPLTADIVLRSLTISRLKSKEKRRLGMVSIEQLIDLAESDQPYEIHLSCHEGEWIAAYERCTRQIFAIDLELAPGLTTRFERLLRVSKATRRDSHSVEIEAESIIGDENPFLSLSAPLNFDYSGLHNVYEFTNDPSLKQAQAITSDFALEYCHVH